MIEYTYFELFLMLCCFVLGGFVTKYREEARSSQTLVRAMLKDEAVYRRIKSDHDTFMKEMRNAD